MVRPIKNINVNIKKLNSIATIPQYAKSGDAGMDVTATSMTITEDYIEYGTGLTFEVPLGYVMLIFPRSGNSKYDLLLCNSVGVLDSGYRGELKIRYKRILKPENFEDESTLWFSKQYEIGDRVAQIMIIPYPDVVFNEVEELSETDRGDGGFGSTGS